MNEPDLCDLSLFFLFCNQIATFRCCWLLITSNFLLILNIVARTKYSNSSCNFKHCCCLILILLPFGARSAKDQSASVFNIHTDVLSWQKNVNQNIGTNLLNFRLFLTSDLFKFLKWQSLISLNAVLWGLLFGQRNITKWE